MFVCLTTRDNTALKAELVVDELSEAMFDVMVEQIDKSHLKSLSDDVCSVCRVSENPVYCTI